MFVLVVTALVALVSGAVVGLKILAPKTKTVVDDKVLAFCEKYQAPLEEFLAVIR
jgi:hypothetical protein